MREYTHTFKKGTALGLRRESSNPRNTEALVQADGLFPEEGVLRAIDPLSIITGVDALGESFPYPQIHVGQAHTLIMGETKIWEYDGSFNLVISGLTPGTIWTVADFYDYIILTNGSQIIKRDAVTQEWSVLEDDYVPECSCVAAVNSQLIVGSPKIYL